MNLQQERLDEFYKELSDCIDQWKNDYQEKNWQLCGDIHLRHPDEVFLLAYSRETDINRWISIIAQRMSSSTVRDTVFDPFFSIDIYTGNLCWFKLAFDLSKILNQTNTTWFTICFPSIKPIDPISFRPLLHVLPIVLYRTNGLPEIERAPNNKRFNDLYFSGLQSPYPCYLYDEKTQQLFRFIPEWSSSSSQPSFSLSKITMDNPAKFAQKLDEMDEHAKFNPRPSNNSPPYKKSHTKLLSLMPKRQKSEQPISASTMPYLAKSRSHSISSELFLTHRKSTPEITVKKNSSEEQEVASPHFINESIVTHSNQFETQETSPTHLRSFSQIRQRLQKGNSKSDFFFIQEIINEYREVPFYFVDSQYFETLITDCGGYPWFDLRGYVLNDTDTQIYPLSSLFYSRFVALGDYHLSQSWYTNPGYPGDIETYSDDSSFFKDKRGISTYKLKPHHYAMHRHFRSIKHSPLSLRELQRMTWKDGVFLYYNNGEVYQNAKHYFQKIIMPTWSYSGAMPKIYLPFLLEIFENFLNSYHQNRLNLPEFRDQLNQWSMMDDFYQFDAYEQQDRFFFYAQLVSERYGSNSIDKVSHSFLELFSHCYYLPIEAIYYDVLNMAYWISSFMPHVVSSSPHFDSIYSDLKIARKFNYKAFIHGMKCILRAAPEHLNFEINSIIRTVNHNKKISTNDINAVIQLYKNYDQFVQVNLEFDHVRPQSHDQAAWQYFAQVLTGAGWIKDPVKLCCPDVINLREPLTGLLFSIFDFRKLIFTKKRTALSALDSSKQVARRYGVFLNVLNESNFKQSLADIDLADLTLSSSIDIPAKSYALSFSPEEINAIKTAALQYHQYFPLSYKEYDGEKLSLSTCLILRYLVDIMMSPDLIVPNNPRFVQERYIFKVIHLESEIPKSNTKKQWLMKYINEFGHLFYTPSSQALDIERKVTIYLKLDETRKTLLCFSQDRVLIEKISLFALLPLDTKKITPEILTNYFPKIIAYLEKKRRINLVGPSMLRKQSMEAFSLFKRVYKNLSCDERSALDSREVTLNGVTKSFREVIENGYYCLLETSVWMMAFLISMNANFKFSAKHESEEAKNKLAPLLYEVRENSYNLGYTDSSLACEKLFISLMITRFVPYGLDDQDQNIEFYFEKCSFYDSSNLVPLDLADNVFRPIIKILFSSNENLEEVYNDILINYLYNQFYKNITQLCVINSAVSLNEIRWVRQVITGDVGNTINLHNFYWYQSVYISININHLDISAEKKELYDGFRQLLKRPTAHYQRLIANIKYMFFLRELSTIEFLKFWGEVDPVYRKDVLVDYLGSQGQLINETNLVNSILKIFKNELQDISSGRPNFSQAFYQPEQLDFEYYLKHLMGLLPPSLERQPSTSPWNYF